MIRMQQQMTIRQPIETVGVGVHSGEKVRLRFSPAPVNSGIIFYRSDCDPIEKFTLDAESVKHTMLNTGLVNSNGAHLSTIEHVLAAVSGLGIDNLIIDVNGAEMPIMDGSAMPFVFLLNEAGVDVQSAPKAFLRVLKPVEVRLDDKFARLKPFDGFRIDATIDFDHPAIDKALQRMKIDINPAAFINDISRARTFGFMKDIELLHQQGLALGGGLDNAIVFDDFRVLNPEGLRHDDELIRHKVLDAIGDLRLCGYNLLAEMETYKPGHHLNNLLVRKLMATTDAWEIVTPVQGADGELEISPLDSLTGAIARV